MDAAEDNAVVLDPMPDDTAAAVKAGGREGLDRAFEAVEVHGAAADGDLEALVVLVAALFTSRYGLLISRLVFCFLSASFPTCERDEKSEAR